LKNEDQFYGINLGCGACVHPSWRNLDINPYVEGVEPWDANLGIPASSNSVDYVYHSHLLEHLSEEQGELLTKECLRILKPGGIVRIALPDLERISRDYLHALEDVDQNKEFSKLNAHWMRLELFDQMTRRTSGGLMIKFLKSSPENKEFLVKRCGKGIIYNFETNHATQDSAVSYKLLPWHFKLKQKIRNLTDPLFLKEKLIKIILSHNDYDALCSGRFQNCGELHKHMYDRISLSELLKKVGFIKCTLQSHFSSLIPRWEEFQLDTTNTGDARKPDSLFLEAIKPK
jgi:predicted SAM-dependent methyltransferase